MSPENDFYYVTEIEKSEGRSGLELLQQIVSTAIGRKTFEAFGVQYPVEFLAWCYTPNYDMINSTGYMPVEKMNTADVLLAASVECDRRVSK